MSGRGGGSIWKTLGLARTDDVAEIRRAYARKLKATDVDADPAAFIALREAFDRALGEAARAAARAPVPITGADPAWPDMAAELAAPPPAELSPDPAAGPAPEPAPAGEDPNARFVALELALFPPQGAPPPAPAALEAALRAILDHPDMAHVDRAAGTELWLAEILHDAIPNSDPLIPFATRQFGWDRKAGDWDQPWLFEALVKRRDALLLVRQLPDPRHRFHKAWRDLTSDSESLWPRPPGRLHEVSTLLTTIRRSAPAAEAWLNPRRVALWDDRLGRSVKGGLRWVAVVFWALFILGRATSFFDLFSDRTPHPPVVYTAVYSDPAGDLDPLIREASQDRLRLADLRTRNPALYARLSDRWQQAHDREESRYVFASDITTLLDEAARAGLRGGSYALQADYWRLRADELGWLRGVDVESCGRAVRGEPISVTYPPEYLDRLRTLQARALAEAPRDPPPALPPGTTRSFPIPGPVVEDMLRRSGLPRAVLDQTFRARGTSAQLCAARIALIQAALAVPEREGARLVRDMSRGL